MIDKDVNMCIRGPLRVLNIPARPKPYFYKPSQTPRFMLDRNMTLCIGALADDDGEPCIVLCSDYKVANENFSSDTEYKLHVLSDTFVSLWSGSPARAKELALIYQGYLEEVILSKEELINQLRVPLAVLKHRLINSFFQRTLGISYQEMLDNGERYFGEEGSRKRHALAVVESHKINLQFIIAGFIAGSPILCELRTDENADKDVVWSTAYSVIGTGYYTAEPALYARNQAPKTPLAIALYNVFEAKKVSELNPYVGSKTRLYVMRDGRMDVLNSDGERWLAKLFKKHGPRPIDGNLGIPENALSLCFRPPVN